VFAREANIDARIEAIYDSNCETLRITNTSSFALVYDNCTAMDAIGICDRIELMLHEESPIVMRLGQLCTHRDTFSAVSYPMYSTQEICDYVANERCAEPVLLLNLSSLSSLFCDSYNNSTLERLQSNCSTLAAFDGCVTQQNVFLVAQGAFVILTMCLYGYLAFLFGGLGGEGGERMIKTIYFRNAMQNEKFWLPIWKHQFASTQAALGQPFDEKSVSRTDALLAAFATFKRDKVPTVHSTYCSPFVVGIFAFRSINVLIVYLMVLYLNVSALFTAVVSSECPETKSYVGSLILFIIFFVTALIFNLIFMSGCCGCRANSVTNEHAFLESNFLRDKSMRYALLTGREIVLFFDDQDVDFDAEIDAFCAAERETR
jgi:hypothetical protein